MIHQLMSRTVPPAPSQVLLRPWRQGDCADALTDMLHQAFQPLLNMGLPCASAVQMPAQTAARLQRGYALVAECDRQLVGALVIYEPMPTSDARTYRSHGTASIHQFAVHPQWQGRGVGRALLAAAEQWALCRDYRAMALDTPSAALHLQAYYRRLGYRPAEALRFTGRPYESTVLCKDLGDRLVPARHLSLAHSNHSLR